MVTVESESLKWCPGGASTFHHSRVCQVVNSISSPFFISLASINEREAWPLSAENGETELAVNGETELIGWGTGIWGNKQIEGAVSLPSERNVELSIPVNLHKSKLVLSIPAHTTGSNPLRWAKQEPPSSLPQLLSQARVTETVRCSEDLSESDSPTESDTMVSLWLRPFHLL